MCKSEVRKKKSSKGVPMRETEANTYGKKHFLMCRLSPGVCRVFILGQRNNCPWRQRKQGWTMESDTTETIPSATKQFSLWVKGTRELLNVFVLREHTAWAVNRDICPYRLLSPLYLLPPVPSVSISSMAFLPLKGNCCRLFEDTEYQCNFFPGLKSLNNCETG